MIWKPKEIKKTTVTTDESEEEDIQKDANELKKIEHFSDSDTETNIINDKNSKHNVLQLESDNIQSDDDDMIWEPELKKETADITDESEEEEDYNLSNINSEMTELREKENWKNKAQSPKKRKSLYLVNHPEKKYKFRAKSKHTIDIIRNGNCLNPTPLKIGKKNH